MKLVIISGRSGSGKSAALHALEDQGYYCIDNLPAAMLSQLPEQLSVGSNEPPKVAVSIDVRNVPGALEQFPKFLKKLKDQGIDCEVLFLDADSDCLMKRYSSTRRKHPLSNKNVSLSEAIELENRLLAPVASEASIRIDTSPMSVHDVHEQVKSRVVGSSTKSMTLMIQSFGFKNGVPIDADFVFDVRCLPNPYWDESIRKFTGLEKPVQKFLGSEPFVKEMLEDLKQFVDKWLPRFESGQRSYMTIAIGCTGGQHRSVYISDQLGVWFSQRFDRVQVRHRELSK
ncbi:glmZ(sRNA)-inactivating NTPase [Endozoicomonas montiporae]|uniref:GlmZ(SRNA)-inactivating NTPase n=2 Tax=Endozoicomonas montiporae TaxID=1027273 RepID=A0A081N2V9_9GAMM|nr:RNase adapter RapZ [Endozoicomonas montiporae]AMO58051.1 nucleotide-binding protein [Endozoicomonas montiporae CL-33]KEQ12782.1 glmZ(sRNA)-inactivating NTPase [Endozoicomonas montiporae]